MLIFLKHLLQYFLRYCFRIAFDSQSSSGIMAEICSINPEDDSTNKETFSWMGPILFFSSTIAFYLLFSYIANLPYYDIINWKFPDCFFGHPYYYRPIRWVVWDLKHPDWDREYWFHKLFPHIGVCSQVFGYLDISVFDPTVPELRWALRDRGFRHIKNAGLIVDDIV
jgi:hypothetical protein